jgi:hypothetical protein
VTDSNVRLGDLEPQHLAAPSVHVRCRLAAGSEPGFTDKISQPLRTRLCLATLIILAGFSIHYGRVLFLQGPTFHDRPL